MISEIGRPGPAGDHDMEFKFSCKWFEIAFSGDPGFVEAQLEKYEKYVQHALDLMEKEAVEDEREDSRTREVREHGQDKSRRRQGKPSKRKNRSPVRREGNGAARKSDHPEDTSKNQSEAPVNEDAVHTARKRPDLVEKPEREADARAGVIEYQDADERDSRPAPEFIGRRRAPRIQDDQLKDIFDQKKPRTHHDRIMVFGYYMEKQGQGSDFTTDEIKKCYRSAGQDPGVNIEQVINHATRSGFIVSHDKGRTIRFKLSSKGRRYVEDGLKLS